MDVLFRLGNAQSKVADGLDPGYVCILCAANGSALSACTPSRRRRPEIPKQVVLGAAPSRPCHAHPSLSPAALFMHAHTIRNVLSKPARTPFRFRGCLYAKKEAPARLAVRRHASTVTLSAPAPTSADDADIVADFDLPQFAHRSSNLTPSGLFGHPVLTTPSSFITLADSTLHRAELLTRRITNARESREELFRVVKNLDRLSDLLCGVIDLAELIRNAHPDPAWVQSAEHGYEKMCEFMNVLNTHVELYEVC